MSYCETLSLSLTQKKFDSQKSRKAECGSETAVKK